MNDGCYCANCRFGSTVPDTKLVDIGFLTPEMFINHPIYKVKCRRYPESRDKDMRDWCGEWQEEKEEGQK